MDNPTFPAMYSYVASASITTSIAAYIQQSLPDTGDSSEDLSDVDGESAPEVLVRFFLVFNARMLGKRIGAQNSKESE